tara:strand:+ start:434 stop:547 length:114 start_codon:yes stop_codon:yes gene_type:complete
MLAKNISGNNFKEIDPRIEAIILMEEYMITKILKYIH